MEDLKELFYFSKKERRGIAVLVLLILLVALAPSIYKQFFYLPPEPLISVQELELLEDKIALNPVYSKPKEPYKQTKAVVNETQIQNSEKASIVTPQEESEIKTTTTQSIKSKPQVLHLEINTATAEDFAKLKGIGPVLSKRIVTYRTKLGGFYSVQQLGTTYGIEPEVFASIKPSLELSTGVKQLNFNNASVDQLAKHPYISPKLAEQIVNYRQKVKPYASLEDVSNLYLVDEQKLQQLKPYISF